MLENADKRYNNKKNSITCWRAKYEECVRRRYDRCMRAKTYMIHCERLFLFFVMTRVRLSFSFGGCGLWLYNVEFRMNYYIHLMAG